MTYSDWYINLNGRYIQDIAWNYKMTIAYTDLKIVRKLMRLELYFFFCFSFHLFVIWIWAHCLLIYGREHTLSYLTWTPKQLVIILQHVFYITLGRCYQDAYVNMQSWIALICTNTHSSHEGTKLLLDQVESNKNLLKTFVQSGHGIGEDWKATYRECTQDFWAKEKHSTTTPSVTKLPERNVRIEEFNMWMFKAQQLWVPHQLAYVLRSNFFPLLLEWLLMNDLSWTGIYEFETNDQKYKIKLTSQNLRLKTQDRIG